MKKPTLEDFGLTQNDLEIYRKQDEQFRDEYKRHVKSIEKISFFITWTISTLILLIVMLLVDSKIFEENAWAILVTPVGSLVFPNLFILAIMDGPYKFLDRYDEIKTKHINKILESKCVKYQEALQKYEQYVKKKSRDYWINMSGLQFEKEVATLFRSQGYYATVTSATGDGGVDIILRKNDERIAVQCKHHAKPVGPNDVRALQGVVAAQDYSKGIFVSLNGFTSSVYYEARNGRVKIELLELKDILEMAMGGCEEHFEKPKMVFEEDDEEDCMGEKPHLGEFVIHRSFGEGRITEVKQTEKGEMYLTVEFAHCIKKFIFPDAFLNGFLAFHGDEAE